MLSEFVPTIILLYIFQCASCVVTELQNNPIVTYEDTSTQISGLSVSLQDPSLTTHSYMTQYIPSFQLTASVQHGTLTFDQYDHDTDDFFHKEKTPSIIGFSGTPRALNAILRFLIYVPPPNWTSLNRYGEFVHEVQAISITTQPDIPISYRITIERPSSIWSSNDHQNGIQIFLDCDSFFSGNGTSSIMVHISNVIPWNISSMSDALNNLIQTCCNHEHNFNSMESNRSTYILDQLVSDKPYAHITEDIFDDKSQQMKTSFILELFNIPFDITPFLSFIDSDNVTIPNKANDNADHLVIQISTITNHHKHDSTNECFEIFHSENLDDKVSINIGISDEEFKRAITKLDNIGDVQVSHSHIPRGYEYHITFFETGYPVHVGDVPLLAIKKEHSSRLEINIYEKVKGQAGSDSLTVELKEVPLMKSSNTDDLHVSISNFNIFVLPVNDLPMIHHPYDYIYTIDEDSYFPLHNANMTISDDDDDFLNFNFFCQNGHFQITKVNDLNIILDSTIMQDENKNMTNYFNLNNFTIVGPWKRMNDYIQEIILFPNHNINGLVEISMTLTDESQGQTNDNLLVYVNPVNDLPTISVKESEIYTESNIETFVGDVTIDDEDAEDTLLTLSISCSNGLLGFQNELSRFLLSFVLEGNILGDKRLVVKARPSKLSKALSDLTYSSYKSFSGMDKIIFELDDGFGDIVNISQNVIVTKQKPIFSMQVPRKKSSIIINEDTKWTNKNNGGIKVVCSNCFEDDLKDEILSIAVSAKHGEVSQLENEIYSKNITTTNQFTFQGNLNDVNKFLSDLVYIPPTDFVKFDYISLNLYHIAQKHSTGSMITIYVTPINDKPVIKCNVTNIQVFEGSTISLPSIFVIDADVLDNFYDIRSTGAGLMTVIIQAKGNIFFDGHVPVRSCLEFGADGFYLAPNKTFCFQATQNQANIGLRNLMYTAPFELHHDEINIVIDDNGNFGNGGNEVTNETIHVKINPDPKISWVTDESYEIDEDSNLLITPDLMLQGTFSKRKALTFISVNVSCSHGKVSHTTPSLEEGKINIISFDENTIKLSGAIQNIKHILSSHGILYTPNKDYNGLDRITLDADVDNDNKTSASEVIDILVRPVNDSPTISVVHYLFGTQNKELNITLLVVDDADDVGRHIEALTLVLSVPVGKIRIRPINPGIWIVSSLPDLVLKGSQDSLNRAIKNEKIYYSPPNEWFGRTMVTAKVIDSISQFAESRIDIEIDPGPVEMFLEVTPKQVAMHEDDSLSFESEGIISSFKAYGNQQKNLIFQCKFKSEHGKLTSSFHSEFIEVGKSTSINSTQHGIQGFLTSLSYKPERNYNGIDFVTFFCTYDAKVVTDELAITIYPKNDPPTFVVSKTMPNFTEDSTNRMGTVFPELYVIDPDVHEKNGRIRAEIQTSHGYLQLPSPEFLGGLSIEHIKNKTRISFVGKIERVNMALPEISIQFDDNWFGNGSFKFTCNDLGNFGLWNKIHHEDRKLINFHVNAVNDDPVIELIEKDYLPFIEDVNKSLKSFFHLEDVDSLNEDILQLEVNIVHVNKVLPGSLYFQKNIESILNVDIRVLNRLNENNLITKVQISGRLASLQAILDSIIFAPSKDWNGMCKCLEMMLTDSLGAKATLNSIISVGAVNDPPKIFATSNYFTLLEDTSALLSEKLNIKIFDDDFYDSTTLYRPTMTVLIKTGNMGKLEVIKSIPGCYFLVRSKTYLLFRGTINVINDAIQHLSFVGCRDCVGSQIISFTVSDEGHYGLGGNLTQHFDVEVNIIAQNDAPTIVRHEVKNVTNFQTKQTYFFLDSEVNDVDNDEMNDLMSVSIFLKPPSTCTLLMSCEVEAIKYGDNYGLFQINGTESDINKALKCVRIQSNIIHDAYIKIEILATDMHGFSNSFEKSFVIKKSLALPRLSSKISNVTLKEKDIFFLDSVEIICDDNQTIDAQDIGLQIFSSTQSVLAMQNITSFVVDFPPPVQEIICFGQLSSYGYFKIGFSKIGNHNFPCISENIDVFATASESKEMKNNTNYTIIDESLETKLNSMICIRKLGIEVEVHMNRQFQNLTHFEHAWRVTFHNTPFEIGKFAIAETSFFSKTNADHMISIMTKTSSIRLRGSFALKLGSHVTQHIDASASEEDFASAISSLPSVSTVSVSRTTNSHTFQSFSWCVTFFQMGKNVLNNDNIDLTLVHNNIEIGGKNGGIAISHSTNRVGYPELWKIDTWLSHDPVIVQRLILSGTQINGFFTLSLSGIGTTEPIHFKTDVKANGNTRGELINMTKIESDFKIEKKIEMLLLKLENWPKYTKLVIQQNEMNSSKTDNNITYVWDITIQNPPMLFPVIEINYVQSLHGNDLVFKSTKISQNLIGGNFRLSWDGLITSPLPYNITAKAMREELYSLIKAKNSTQNIEIVREENKQSGSYTWTVALLYSSSLNLVGSVAKNKLIAIDTDLIGSGVQIMCRMKAAGPRMGKFSFSKEVIKGLYFPSRKFRGESEVVQVRGSIKSLNEALKYMNYSPAEGYGGLVTIHVLIEGETSTPLLLNVKVLNEDHPPFITWNDRKITKSAYDIIEMIEDSFLFFENYAHDKGYATGIRVSDVDGGLENLTVEIVAENGHVCEKDCLGTKHEKLNNSIILHGPLFETNSKLATIVYKPALNWWGHDQIVLNILSNETTETGILHVKILPINDPPRINIRDLEENSSNNDFVADPVTLEAKEDQSISIDLISLSDEDASTSNLCALSNKSHYPCFKAQQLQNVYTLELSVSQGILSIDIYVFGLSIIREDEGSSYTITLQGKIESINEALASLTYVGNLDYHGDDILFITAQDYGLSYNSSIDRVERSILSCKRNITIKIMPINDPPYIVLPLNCNGNLTALEDITGVIGSTCVNGKPSSNRTLFVLSCDNIEIHDVDIVAGTTRNETIIDEYLVTLVPKFGSIELKHSGVIEKILNHSDSSIQIKGSLQAVNQAIRGMHYIGSPNFNSELASKFDNIQVSVKDFDGTFTSSTLFIFVKPVNDFPKIELNMELEGPIDFIQEKFMTRRLPAKEILIHEDTLKTIPISIQDQDLSDDNDFIEVEIFSSHGSLLVDENAVIERWIIGEAGNYFKILKFQCTLESGNNELQSLIYRPDSNYYGRDKLIVYVSDMGNHGIIKHMNETIELTDPEREEPLRDILELSIFVSPIVDLPVIEVESFIEGLEDTPIILDKMIHIVHVDAPEDELIVSLNCTHATVSLASIEGITFMTGDGKLDSIILGSGTVDSWNRALSKVKYSPEPNWNTYNIEDNMIVFTVGYAETEETELNMNIMYLEVKPVKDAPEWIMPARDMYLLDTSDNNEKKVEQFVVEEDNDLIINDLSVIDVDMIGRKSGREDVVTIHISLTFGKLKLKTKEGLWFLKGKDASNFMTFKASLSNANTALSRLVYRGDTDFFGLDEIKFHVSDEGSNGFKDGFNISVAMQINVLPVDDSPELIIPEAIIYCREKIPCLIKEVSLLDPDSKSELYNLEVTTDNGNIAFTANEYPASIQFFEENRKISTVLKVAGSLKDLVFFLSNLAYISNAIKGEYVDFISFVVQSMDETSGPTQTTVAEIYVIVKKDSNSSPIIKVQGEKRDTSACSPSSYSKLRSELIAYNTLHARENIDCNRLIQIDYLTCDENTLCDIKGISVEDSDSEVIDLHLKVENGQVKISPVTDSVRLIKGQRICSDTYTSFENELLLRGTPEQINTSLLTLKYLGNQDFFGIEHITISAIDEVFQESEGSTETFTLLLKVEQIDDQLFIHTSTNILEVTEDKFLTISGLYVKTKPNIDVECFEIENYEESTLTNDMKIKHHKEMAIIKLNVASMNGKIRFNSVEAINFTASNNHTGSNRLIHDNMLLTVGHWWENVTLQGTIRSINRAIKNLLYLPHKDWNSETSKGHTQLRFHVKRVSDVASPTDLVMEDEVVYDHSAIINIVVNPENDPPSIVFGKEFGYVDEINFTTSDELAMMHTRFHRILLREDEHKLIHVAVQDIDDDILTVKIEAEKGVSIITPNMNQFEKYKELIFISESREHSNFIKIRGDIDLLNDFLLNMRVSKTSNLNGDDYSFVIYVEDNAGLRDQMDFVITILPVNDGTEFL